MKWLCLILAAMAKAIVLEAQEAITSLPWIMDDEQLLPVHRYDEGIKENFENPFAAEAKGSTQSLFATVLLGTGFIHSLLLRNLFSSAHSSKKEGHPSKQLPTTFTKQVLHFFNEIKAIFGIWIIPLLASATFLYDWEASMNFLNTRNYTEALFIAVIMTIASSNPIMNIIESLIRKIASLCGGSTGAWWVALLTVGPILGSIITEAGAMIVTSLLLAKQFYSRRISQKLAYATLGLLFTHISLGAILTNFCLPVSWINTDWEAIFTLALFGGKSILAIVTSTFCYYLYFRKEFAKLEKEKSKPLEKIQIPWWVTAMHILFLSGAIVSIYFPLIFITISFLFLLFHEATREYQTCLKLRPPMLVGFFFSGLVIHGGLQEWWITPLIERIDALVIACASFMFGSFMDGTTLTYIATLLPSLSDATKYSVIVGTLAVGGLSMIGNAPTQCNKEINPHFAEGISPKKLFLAALFPMFVTASIFLIFRI